MNTVQPLGLLVGRVLLALIFYGRYALRCVERPGPHELGPGVTRAWFDAQGEPSVPHPFFYGTEASVNRSEDGELLDLMVRANFTWVFLGIESPSAESLKETRKFQNLRGSLEGRVQGAIHFHLHLAPEAYPSERQHRWLGRLLRTWLRLSVSVSGASVASG